MGCDWPNAGAVACNRFDMFRSRFTEAGLPGRRLLSWQRGIPAMPQHTQLGLRCTQGPRANRCQTRAIVYIQYFRLAFVMHTAGQSSIQLHTITISSSEPTTATDNNSFKVLSLHPRPSRANIVGGRPFIHRASCLAHAQTTLVCAPPACCKQAPTVNIL